MKIKEWYKQMGPKQLVWPGLRPTPKPSKIQTNQWSYDESCYNAYKKVLGDQKSWVDQKVNCNQTWPNNATLRMLMMEITWYDWSEVMNGYGDLIDYPMNHPKTLTR